MYGSKKPEGEPYILKYIFDKNMEEFEIETDIDLIKKLSLLYEINETETTIEKKNVIPKEKKKNIKEIVVDENFVKQLLNIVKPERADNYEDWLLIGAILYNTNTDFLNIFKEWSAKSYKYDEDKCEELWEKTYPNYRGNTATLGTLRKMAREDNQMEYLNFVSQFSEKDDLIKLIVQSNSITHQDFAEVLAFLFKDKYKYCGNNIWCRFNGIRWEILNSEPVELKKLIRSELIPLYLNFMKIINPNDEEIDEENEEEETDKKTKQSQIKHLKKVINNLKNTNMKAGIVTELKDFFYDKKFIKNLDKNIYLLGFDDGVYDCINHEFRKGLPEDKITFSVGYNFPREVNQEMQEKVMNIFESVLPDKEVRNFVMKFFASTLIGKNSDELFINFEGSGGNGKGLISSLHEITLGEYATTLNNNYLVNAFNSPESHNTMLANVIDKRYVQVNEPPNNKKLNLNFIKEITGRDKIQLRKAHSNETDEVEPMFKLVMLFNELPQIDNTQDGGFRRRFYGINFPNKFVDNPRRPNELKKDNELKNVIRESVLLRQQYMLILFRYLKKYQKDGLQIPQEIIRNSNRLLNEQEPVQDFLDQTCLQTCSEEDYIRAEDLWDEFKEFFKTNYNEKNKYTKKQFIHRILDLVNEQIVFQHQRQIEIDGEKRTIKDAFFGMTLNFDGKKKTSSITF